MAKTAQVSRVTRPSMTPFAFSKELLSCNIFRPSRPRWAGTTTRRPLPPTSRPG